MDFNKAQKEILDGTFTANNGGDDEKILASKGIKSRIIGKSGLNFFTLKTESIAFFFTENSLVFGVDNEGNKYMIDCKNLFELSQEVNQKLFYRVNRKYMVNINYISKFRSFEKVKLLVELVIKTPDAVIISQQGTKAFKEWVTSL